MYNTISVKIMRSFDYGHFEIALGKNSEESNLTNGDADELRKEAMRLVDKAVNQYIVAKRERERDYCGSELDELRRKVKIIKENFPASEWTSEQKALLKRFNDLIYALDRQYDYQDDWEEQEREENKS